VEYARDLGQVDLWEESLRRSLERRGRPRRSSVELHRLKPARDLTLADVIERSAHYSQLRRQAAQRPGLPRPSAALSGVSAMALLAAATVPKLVGGGGSMHKPTAVVKEASDATPVPSQTHATIADSVPRPATHPPRLMRPVVSHHAATRSAPIRHSAQAPAPTSRTTTSTPHATIASVSHSSGGAGLAAGAKQTVAKPRASEAHSTPSPSAAHSSPAPSRHAATTTTSNASGGVQVKPKAKVTPTTPTHTSAPTTAPVSSGGYVNPLAHASVTPERIDQGVDYSGSGTLTAIGAGRVILTSGGGWPGNFIEYRLTSGAYAGRYVYYAEGVSPVSGLRVGQSVRPGQPIATMSGGIEIGWASGVGTQPLAQAQGQWGHSSDAENYASPAGRSFSALIASLGGPPGKIEG
jgi:hypothetical protein